MLRESHSNTTGEQRIVIEIVIRKHGHAPSTSWTGIRPKATTE